MKELKVGIIGTGFIGKQHIEAIRRIPGTRILAVSDTNEAEGKQVAAEQCIPGFYQDYHEMLKDTGLDIVHNCTPNFLHFAVNKDIIAAGKHVYCEKPLALNFPEAKEISELAERKGVMTGVNFNYRNNVMVHEMKAQIQEQKIGNVFMVYGEYLQDLFLYPTDYNWRMDPSLSGESRAVADIGSHCFDTAQYILGQRITSVYARMLNLYPARKKMEQSKNTFDVVSSGKYSEVPVSSEDAAFIMAEFEDKTKGLFQVSQITAGSKNGLSLTANGTTASLKWNQERADHLFIGHRDTGNEDIYASPQYVSHYARPYATLPNGHSVGWADAFRNGIASFYEHIRQPELPFVHAEFKDGCQIVKIVDACIKSHKENRWVVV